MLHTIIITHADGTTTTLHTQADTAKQAHEYAETHRAEPTDAIRVYATTQDENGAIIIDGVRAGALTVCKRTTANMLSREGGNIQYRLYNAVRNPVTDDPDALDCISVAQIALLDAIADGEPIGEQYHRAYLALNRHLRASKQINLNATAMRTIYIEDINGDIISVNGEINRILAPNERYTPAPDTDTPTVTTAQIEAIKNIIATLTPTQIAVLRYMAKGYSVRQIAECMHRSAPTIQVHINHIRDKAVTIYPNGYKCIIG